MLGTLSMATGEFIVYVVTNETFFAKKGMALLRSYVYPNYSSLFIQKYECAGCRPCGSLWFFRFHYAAFGNRNILFHGTPHGIQEHLLEMFVSCSRCFVCIFASSDYRVCNLRPRRFILFRVLFGFWFFLYIPSSYICDCLWFGDRNVDSKKAHEQRSTYRISR